MYLYSLIFVVVAILGLIYLTARYIKHRISIITYIIGIIAMLFIILFSIFPTTSSIFAKALGIARGLDFVFIGAIFILLYIVLRLYFIIEDLNANMDKIVKEVALNNEIKYDDE